jgi:ABC-2 type transport system permease protein
MSSAVASGHQAVPTTQTGSPSVPFTATLRSEWSKLVTIRSTWFSAIVALVLSVGFTSFLAWVTGWSWADWNEADRASFDPITFTLTGIMFAGIVFVVIGVNLVASEYSSGMIRQTFTTTPKRGRILAAKAIVATVITIVLATLIFIPTFYAGQFVFGIYDLPTVGLGDSDALRTMIGLVLTAPIMPLIGVVAAFLFRSAAAAITTALAIVFLPSMFGALFPDRWQENLLAYLPASLGDSIALAAVTEADNPMYKDPWLAAGALLVWAVVLFGGTLWALNRRDV